LNSEITQVLKAKLPDSDMLNVLQALGYSQDRFQDAFDIALTMENQNLVKLLYSNFHAGKIVIEFTRLGKLAAIEAPIE
jgi:hypothetical protein